jgi:hypothetical protein
MTPVEFALARMSVDELSATAAATYVTPPPGPPGLVAWIEHCVDMELHRRQGTVLVMRAPSEAIPPEEDVPALAAMIALCKAADRDNVHALYAAMVKLLSDGPRH